MVWSIIQTQSFARGSDRRKANNPNRKIQSRPALAHGVGSSSNPRSAAKSFKMAAAARKLVAAKSTNSRNLMISPNR